MWPFLAAQDHGCSSGFASAPQCWAGGLRRLGGLQGARKGMPEVGEGELDGMGTAMHGGGRETHTRMWFVVRSPLPAQGSTLDASRPNRIAGGKGKSALAAASHGNKA